MENKKIGEINFERCFDVINKINKQLNRIVIFKKLLSEGNEAFTDTLTEL